MNAQIAAILAIDGIASGAIYVLIAIGLVLVFLVTRVLYVPFGDIAAFTVLTLAALETGQVPGTIWLVGVLAVLASAIEAVSLLRARRAALIPRALLFYLLLPLIPAAVAWFVAPLGLGMPARILLALLLILPIAPLLDRIVFRPIADASVLLLLIVALALHFALAGFGLLFFGPEGVRTQPLADARFEFFGVILSLQTRARRRRRGRVQRAVVSVLRIHHGRQGAARDVGQSHGRAPGRASGPRVPARSPICWPHCWPASPACLIGAGSDDLLRLRLPDRAQGLCRLDLRRARELSDDGARRGLGWSPGKLCLVLEQRLQGGHRLFDPASRSCCGAPTRSAETEEEAEE